MSPESGLESTGAHYPADHCEIFVDKLLPTNGSHFSLGLTVFVKILPSRLDSPAAEVGFRSLRTGHDLGGTLAESWQDRTLQKFHGAADYFLFSSPLSHDFGDYAFEGVFYVRTTAGTTYWLKPSPATNYRVDARLATAVAAERGGRTSYLTTDPQDAIPVQASRFQEFNPGNCY